MMKSINQNLGGSSNKAPRERSTRVKEEVVPKVKEEVAEERVKEEVDEVSACSGDAFDLGG